MHTYTLLTLVSVAHTYLCSCTAAAYDATTQTKVLHACIAPLYHTASMSCDISNVTFELADLSLEQLQQGRLSCVRQQTRPHTQPTYTGLGRRLSATGATGGKFVNNETLMLANWPQCCPTGRSAAGP